MEKQAKKSHLAGKIALIKPILIGYCNRGVYDFNNIYFKKCGNCFVATAMKFAMKMYF